MVRKYNHPLLKYLRVVHCGPSRYEARRYGRTGWYVFVFGRSSLYVMFVQSVEHVITGSRILFSFVQLFVQNFQKRKNQHSRISLFQMPIFDPIKVTLRIIFYKTGKDKKVNWNSLTVFKYVTLENYQDIRKILQNHHKNSLKKFQRSPGFLFSTQMQCFWAYFESFPGAIMKNYQNFGCEYYHSLNCWILHQPEI